MRAASSTRPVDRVGLVRVQTPQAFRLADLRRAYANLAGDAPTDETSVMRAAGMTVAAVDGDPSLEKLTTPADWARAEAMLAARLIPRTGLGFDVHAFAGEGPVMLGGIAVPHPRGLAGHSDADVVLHAITDALLGAAGLGDIGEHFPPSDPQWKGAASDRFLSHAAAARSRRRSDHRSCGLSPSSPRSRRWARIEPPCASASPQILGLRPDQVSIKATTTEGLGFTGRREGHRGPGGGEHPHGTRGMKDTLLPKELVDKAREVVEANRKAGRRIAVAESCTGGLISAALTEIAGSSDVFEAGYVTYSNASKISQLKVSEDVVDTFGAVSIATAWAMARGALAASEADVAVAITGIAGPGGGSPAKPVGTVVFARAERDADPAQDRRRSEDFRVTRTAPACGFRRRFARSTC